MFKKALLTLTALTAISLLPVPYAGPADAAVKIKPATVKLKAKIRVVKPKARIKVRVKVRKKVRIRARKTVRTNAAKVRVKKTKTKTKAAKLKIKPAVRGINGKKNPIRIRTVRPTVKVNPNLKQLAKKRRTEPTCWGYNRRGCRKAPANAVAKRVVPANAKAKLTNFDKTRLERRTRSHAPGHRGFLPSGNVQSEKGAQANASNHPSFKYPDPAFLADAARFAELGQAASLAEDLKGLQDTLRVAGHDSGELDMLFTPFNPDAKTPVEAAANPSGLHNPPILGGIRVAGVGSGVFGFVPNSHSKNAPSHTLGVDIAGAIGGVAGSSAGWVNEPGLPGVRHRQFTTPLTGGGKVVIYIREYPNHHRTTAHTYYNADGALKLEISRTRDQDGNVIPEQSRTRSYGDGEPDDTGDFVIRQDGEKPSAETPKPADGGTKDFAKQYDPDYVGGGGCQSMACILSHEKPKGLTKTDMTPGGLPPAPNEAHAQNRNGTAPLYSANDVLERYDPDNENRSGGSGGKNTVGPGGLPEDPNG